MPVSQPNPRRTFRIAGGLTLACGAVSMVIAVIALNWGSVLGGVLGRGEATVKMHLLILFAAGVTLLPLGAMTLASRARAAVIAAFVEAGYAAWLFASTRHPMTFALAGLLLCGAALCLLAAATAPPASRSVTR